MVQLKYTCGMVEVRSWYGQGMLLVRSRYVPGTVVEQLWCASGTLPVLLVSLIFLSDNTVGTEYG